MYILAEGVGETTGTTVLRDESVLQINCGFTNEVIGCETIPIHHCDGERVVLQITGGIAKDIHMTNFEMLQYIRH